jgi:Uncharacterized protein conserved in bacteria (DUF2059)
MPSWQPKLSGRIFVLKKIILLTGVAFLGIATPAVANDEAAKSTVEAATVDPVRLAIAEKTVAKLIPPGTYARIMKDMVDNMASGLIEQMMGIDASAMAKAVGAETVDGQVDAEATADDATETEKSKTIGEMAAERDPHFKERMDITMKVMFTEMGSLMGEMEPIVRDAMAKIYARKYTVKELTDMNNFFSTPSGSSFATNFMSSFTDKEMINASFGMMPKLMEAMPGIMKRVEAATAHLPPLANTETQTADAADPYANETGDEPWYAESNWNAAARKKVKALEAKYDVLQAKSEDAGSKSSEAYEIYESAWNEATGDARTRYLADGWKPQPVIISKQDEAAEDVVSDTVTPAVKPN